ncbi:MAG: tetratricopeptide repeat protein [Betaproteobacteria bacterium]|nr:tetratricopeptide repeat protein [Betaproteobacteria bacterium]
MAWLLSPRIALVALVFCLLPVSPAAAQADDLQEVNRLFKQRQYDRALERVDAYLATRPKDARARFTKGVILAEQNKTNDAIKVFIDLTQEFPELPEPYNNLAVLYASQGQYDKARNALEMAIRTHPSYATAHENLGDIYAKMASQAYDKALQLDRGNTAAQTKLNLIRELFTGSPRPPKTAATKPEPQARVALATPAPKPAPAEPQASAKTAEPPAKPAAAAPAKAPESAAAPKPAIAPPQVPAKSAEPPVKPAAGKEPATARNPDEVLKALNEWAKAWSDNDVAGYLARYAPDFKTPNGESRSDWEAQRKARIAKPRRIEVVIEAPKVKFNGNGHATVTFRQHYRSDSLKISSTKTLEMVKGGDKWLIQQERVGG